MITLFNLKIYRNFSESHLFSTTILEIIPSDPKKMWHRVAHLSNFDRLCWRSLPYANYMSPFEQVSNDGE